MRAPKRYPMYAAQITHNETDSGTKNNLTRAIRQNLTIQIRDNRCDWGCGRPKRSNGWVSLCGQERVVHYMGCIYCSILE